MVAKAVKMFWAEKCLPHKSLKRKIIFTNFFQSSLKTPFFSIIFHKISIQVYTWMHWYAQKLDAQFRVAFIRTKIPIDSHIKQEISVEPSVSTSYSILNTFRIGLMWKRERTHQTSFGYSCMVFATKKSNFPNLCQSFPFRCQ